MMAAAAAFRTSEPELGVLAFAGYPLAAGVAFGLWMSDRHWASDILSGALLGEAIGSSAGRSFARSQDLPETFGLRGSPWVTGIGGGALVGWSGEW
jgi:membrane-associated phospholipid phosphatase